MTQKEYMELSPRIIDALQNADSKALATCGTHGINVVPVSTIRVVDGKIWLMNYFMGKTLDNILKEPFVALAFWKGLEGFQIKGRVRYEESGPSFEEAATWVLQNIPDRIVKGLIILEPEEVHDITPSALS